MAYLRSAVVETWNKNKEESKLSIHTDECPATLGEGKKEKS